MRQMALALIVTAGLVAGSAGPAPVVAQQKPIEIRFGHVGFPGSLFDRTANEFAKRVNEALKGRVEMKVFHSSQLGTDADMLKGIKVGTLEMFLPSTIMSTVDDLFGAWEMPYLIRDRKHLTAVTRDPEVRAALFDRLPAKGVRALAWWENGFRHVTNNVRPIRAPEDLKGIKLRTPRGVWRVKMFQAYGASPTPLSFAEVYSALQTGVMDGQENPFAQIHSGKFQEVQKYMSLTGHVYTPGYPVVGEKWWGSLPADVRQVIERIANEMTEWIHATSVGMENELKDPLCAKMACNEVDKQAFIRASKPIYEEFGTKVPGGKELIAKVQAL